VHIGLLLKHVTRILHIVSSFGAPQAPPCFRHYLINGAIFGKKLLKIKCVFLFSLQNLSITFLILKKIERDIVLTVKTSSCEVQVRLVGF
jgi:hypothetical protein